MRLFTPLLGVWAALVGCHATSAGHPTALPLASTVQGADVVLVPGCPTLPDGRLSHCLWRRVVWAAWLYEQGVAPRFIASGSAAHNPYVEAQAIRAGLVALGVPDSKIVTETQALHTDENVAFGMVIADQMGWERIGVASDKSHSRGACKMLAAWKRDCVDMPLNKRVVAPRMRDLPDVRADPLSDWRPLAEQERARADAAGRRFRRAPSPLYYPWMAIQGRLGRSRPPVPPLPEPTLAPEAR